MTGPQHKCGVVGIAASHNVVPAIQKSLLVMQHRGQESAGISVFKDGEISTVKNDGFVQFALSKEKIECLDGNIGIGHVRYSMAGYKGELYAQPFTVATMFGTVAVAHNGEIADFKNLRDRYMSEGMVLATGTDTEFSTNLFVRNLAKTRDPVKALKQMMTELDASFAMTIMVNNRLFGIRDAYGLRPLCIGQLSDGYILSSESAAIDALGGKLVRDVLPGEVVEITAGGVIEHGTIESKPKAYCSFEWVYFARIDSVLDGRGVYDVRKNIGMILAKEHPADADFVMPVPDSGRAHAIGYAIAAGLPYEEGFMKNRFIERTFILPEQSQREAAVAMKMIPIKSAVAGKRLVLVDDSIVRGTTLKKLISMLRDAGAKEVHVRVGSPPTVAPCYYGVDMKTREEFIANKYTEDEIRQIIGADSLGYISVDGLVEAIGKPKCEICLACGNGEYPTKIPGEKCRYQSTLNF